MAPRAAAAAVAAASPIGLALSKTYEIGSLIGKGAFGEVYAVNEDKKSTCCWVVKVAPIPTKISKKQNTPAEMLCNRLYHEYLVYTNCRQLSGSSLPLMPSKMTDKIDLYYDNLDGFRCLVMEHLHCHLFDALRHLVTTAGRFVMLGQTAGKLITIVEQMHELGYLIIDIKPDNFMVASTLGTDAVTDDSLAESVRLIDLGLAKTPRSANDGTSGLAGNALYASLNVHEFNTPARRDDVQSILFLIADIVLTVQALDLGKVPPYGKGDRASHLPWSQANSDEAVGAAKRANVLVEDSEFYQQMPSEAAKVLFECITDSSSLKYKQTPSYKDLRQALSTLKVPRTANRKPAPRSSKTAEAVKPPPTQKSSRKTTLRSASSRDAASNLDDQQQDRAPKRSSKAARIRSLYDVDGDVEMEEGTVSDVDMENESNVIMAKNVDLSVTGFGLYCQDADLWIVLSKDNPKVVIGKSPSCKGVSSLIVLKSKSLLPTHVTLKLGEIPGTVSVKPHNEAAIVVVEDFQVPVSGTCAFAGQTIAMGDFSFQVRNLPINKLSPAKNVATKQHILTTSPRKHRPQPRINGKMLTEASSSQKPRAQPHRRRALLEIVAGSLKGNKYELIPDSRNVIIVGSDPSGDCFLVTLDEVGVAENHVRFELSHNQVGGTTVIMHVLTRGMGLVDPEVNGDVIIDADIISIAENSIIKLSDDAHVAVHFKEDK